MFQKRLIRFWDISNHTVDEENPAPSDMSIFFVITMFFPNPELDFPGWRQFPWPPGPRWHLHAPCSKWNVRAHSPVWKLQCWWQAMGRGGHVLKVQDGWDLILEMEFWECEPSEFVEVALNFSPGLEGVVILEWLWWMMGSKKVRDTARVLYPNR